MSDNNSFPLLQRPAFFDGQRLTASDLEAAQRYHRELRWLHNRSLHNWGIAFGYAVSGKRGDRTVTVQPGYAFDCNGRELILFEAMTLTIPAVAGGFGGQPATYYLTASYVEDADLSPETRSGACNTSGAVRRPETAGIQWRRVDEINAGIHVILALVQIKNCQLFADVSSSGRRDALPAQQPFIASGQTQARETEWRLWPESPEDAEGNPIPSSVHVFLGVVTTVPTTNAGFRTPPRYQAHVVGSRVAKDLDESLLGDNPERINLDEVTVVLDGYAQVANASAFSFDLIVTMPTAVWPTGRNESGNLIDALMNPPGIFNDFLVQYLTDSLQWHVVWVGTEG